MCMIAHRFLGPKGKGGNIPNEVIGTAMTRHSDGFGIAWRDPEDGLVYEKFGPQPEHARLFRDRLKEIDSDKAIEYVAHFRFATHGPEDADHAHPFAYDDPDPKVGTVLVFHNGIISGVKTGALESDTEVFVRDYLSKLPSRWWDNPGIRRLVDHMGGWSRLVLMTNDETINLNYSQGEDDGGLWYSSDHRPYKYATYTKSTGISYSTPKESYGFDGEEAYEAWLAAGADDEELSVYGLTKEGYRPRPTVGAIGPQSTTPMGNDALWLDNKHTLTPLVTFDFSKDGDYPRSITCDECGTEGDVYLIGGKAYVDMTHDGDILYDENTRELAVVKVTEMEAAYVTPKGETALITLPTGASGTAYSGVPEPTLVN